MFELFDARLTVPVAQELCLSCWPSTSGTKQAAKLSLR